MYSNQQMLVTFFCLFQDDEYVAFPDIKPAAKHHYLIVTREHIKDVKVLTAEQKLVGKWRLFSGEIKLETKGHSGIRVFKYNH